MNTKSLLCLSCLFAVTLATSTVDAGPRRNGGNNRVASRPSRSVGVARSFVGGNRIANWNGQRFQGQRFATSRNWSGRNWNGQRWGGNHLSSNNWYWHHHHRHFRDFVFVDFGFPFFGWWGDPYYYDYGYYPYGYDSYPYGSSYGSYDNGYYGDGYYGSMNTYRNGYNNSYGYNTGSNVAELQRKLADAGYYRGEIDGVFGPRTKYALRAYRHDHPSGNSEDRSYGNSPTLRARPYSPPPVTTEPSQDE